MIEGDINERMLRFAPSQGVPFKPDPIALEVLAETEADAPPAVAAGFDPIAMQIARESQEEMMATLRGASAVNPDQAARAQRIGRQVGIGQDVVLRNMAEMEREAVARQVIDRDLMRTAPNLARFLGQREFATIAHDDIDGLTKAERTFRWFAGIPKDVEEGLSRAIATSELGKMYERQMQGIEPTWLDKVVIKSYNDELRRVSEESGFIESAANIVGIQAEMAAQVPESVAMGALMGGGWAALGGPLAPATVPAGLAAGATVGLGVGFARAAYVLEAGNAYGSMIEEGIDREDARRIATGVGVVNAGLELVGLKLISAAYRTAFQTAVRRAVSAAVAQQTTRAALATAGRQYRNAVLGETGTEVLQEIFTVAGEELGRYGSDLPLKMSTEEGRAEVAKRLVDTAVDTAKGMSLVGLPGPAVNFYVNTRKVAEARKAERLFTDLADASKEVKVAERSPLAYESFLAAQVEGTAAETIFVDARTMQSVLQQAQRDDPALTDAVIDEAMPGIREQIAQQLETGGDVTIPTAQFGARLARTTLGRQMIPHMRLNPDALSVTEAVKHREQMDALRAEAVRLMQEQDAAGASFSQEAEAVRDGMRSKLEAAGRDREAADVESMLYRDFVVTQAARRGMTPAQFEAESGVRGVEGAMAPAAAPLEQPAQFTTSGERRTDTPEFKAWSQNAPIYEADEPGFTTGTPMVVKAYHGTDKTFVKFKMDRPAWFAARPGTAGEYVAGGRRKMGDKPKRGSQIIPVYLAFQNPLDLRYNVGGQTTVTPQSRMSMVDVLSAAGLPNDEAALRAIAERNLAANMAGVADTIADKAGYLANTYSEPLKLWSLLDDYGLIETLKDAGFDGLILNEGGNIFAAFNDNDIKSPNNRGTWSRTSPNIMEQAPVAPGFYSALEREVGAIDAKALTASGWAERFKGLISKGAIKADELEWSGLSDYLKMQEGKVSKDAVLEFLRGNGVRVERDTLGGPPANIDELRNALARAEMAHEDALERETVADLGDDEAAAIAATEAANQTRRAVVQAKMALDDAERATETKYERYTLPGGTNYREVLLTLPREDRLPAGYSLVQQDDKWNIADSSGKLVMPNVLYGTTKESAIRNAIAYLKPGQLAVPFQTPHWDQLNVLVHLRMNDRVDADGKRVLFVEEVQSDWGQAGRKKGFVGQVPRAPFVETTDGWLNLGLKQVLLEAVRGNYDRVAFVNGEQSADRYDLSKQVDRIVVAPREGKKRVNIELRDGSILFYGVDENGIISETTDESMQIAKAGTPLADVIGKELADKIMHTKRGTFKGADLKVGGEGMGAFYDKIVPIAMNKLLKKYGGEKVGEVLLPNMQQTEMQADAERMGMTVADVLDVAEPSEYQQNQPGFAVTPEMVKKLESGLPLFQAAAAPTPGPRGGFDPKRLTILLNKQADLSTFLHELSHYFLATYTDLAARGVASPEQLADLDTTLQWFGIAGDTPAARLAAWNALPLDGQRPFHEQFAYNFEVYAFEGKSPSVELRGVFERFSAYLKRVYKSIRDELNAIYRREFGKDLPILTGEVRSVFDRMLASDEAIRRQQAIDGVKPAFLTREQAGVDEATWAEHQAALADAEAIAVGDMTKASMRAVQWMSNGRSRIVKEMQAKHDAKRKEVREEVAAQVRMEPAYRAQAYLRYGRFIDADGQEVEIEGPHKLDLDTVKKMYELEPEAIRPDVAAMARGKYGFVGKDGLNPDVVAETFGYSSGDQMIRAVTGLKPIKEAIDERTDAVMQERFGDMNTKEAVDAEVQKAMHNEARARFVAIELKFASKATAPARVIVEAARQAARDIIAAKKVRDVRPSEHVAAEARAAREAVTAGQFPDPSATAQAASTRAYNEAIAAGKDEAAAGDEAMQAGLRAAEAARARIAEFESRYPGATREQVIIRAKRQEMYQNQLAAEALRVRDEVEKDVKYLRRVLRDENVKRMGADATDQVAELLSRFDVAGVPLKILDRRKATLAAWMEAKADGGIVPDIAPELLEAGRRVNYRDMTVAEFRDLVSAVKQIEYVGKNERKLQLAEEKAEFEEKRDEIVTRIRAVGRLRGLDLDPRTPLTNIGRTVSKLRNFAASHLKAASIARVLDGGKDDGPLWNTVIRTANAAADMETRMRAEATARLAEILKPVFALGNMGGKGMFFQTINRSLNREARIAIAMNMGNAGNVQRLLDGEGWTMAQLQPVLESLTADEWNAVQATWDFLETYRPLVGAKERRLYGKEPNWVEPQPLTVRTADGQTLTLRGGYYPVKYDPVASDRVATFDEVQEAKDALRGTYTAATTRRSFTKARAEKVTDRPILYTLDAAFSGVNDVIHDLAWHEWLISTNRLLRDQEFANAVRETRGPEFLKQLRDWAKDNAAGDRSSNVEGVLSWLRQGISASGLGFNVMSAALQITGFNQSVVRVGAKYVGLGIAEFTASPFATSAMVRDKSSFMAERQRTQFRELNELRNTVRGKNAGVRKALAQAYVAMMTMQRAVDTPTWVGAYRKALDGGKDDATAVALADQAVKDSQGSGLTSDLAAIERGGPGLRLFTVFYSYMNTVYNMAAVQTMTARGKGKVAADYVLLMVVPVVLGHAIKSLLTPDAGDDDFDPEALARKLVAEELSFLMGTMVVAREFGGAAQLLTGAEGARMGYGGPAGVRAIGEAYNLATQTGQMEFDRAWFRSAINTLGAFTGLPSAQINRTIDGIEAIMEGEVEGVGAVVAPLTGVRR